MSTAPDTPSLPIVGLTTLWADDLSPAIARLPLFRQKWLYLAAAAALVGMLVTMNHGQWTGLAPFIVFTIVFQAFVFLGPRLLAKRSIATMASHIVRYQADADGLSISNAGTTVTRRWDVLERFVETEDAFLVWVGPSAIQILAKRAFSPAEQDWLRATLTSTARRRPRASGARKLRLLLIWAVLVVVFLAVWQLLQSARR
jgi:hypothetical protein